MASLSLHFYSSDVGRLALLPDDSKSEKWTSQIPVILGHLAGLGHRVVGFPGVSATGAV